MWSMKERQCWRCAIALYWWWGVIYYFKVNAASLRVLRVLQVSFPSISRWGLTPFLPYEVSRMGSGVLSTVLTLCSNFKLLAPFTLHKKLPFNGLGCGRQHQTFLDVLHNKWKKVTRGGPQKNERDFLWIFPKRRIPPLPPFGHPLFKTKFEVPLSHPLPNPTTSSLTLATLCQHEHVLWSRNGPHGRWGWSLISQASSWWEWSDGLSRMIRGPNGWSTKLCQVIRSFLMVRMIR